MSAPRSEYPYPVKYFRQLKSRPMSLRNFFNVGPSLRFLVLTEQGGQHIVDSDGLNEFLNLPVASSNTDLVFCRGRAKKLRNAGDTESWGEYPTGRIVKFLEPDEQRTGLAK